MKALIKYLKNSREELAKVSWPSKEQTINSTILVVVVSVFIATFLGAIDYGLSRLLEYLLINF
jgi:preprotein translocase subunit SecE